MYYGKFSDRYNGKKKDRKKKAFHKAAEYSDDKGMIQRHKFVRFFKAMMRMKQKV